MGIADDSIPAITVPSNHQQGQINDHIGEANDFID